MIDPGKRSSMLGMDTLPERGTKCGECGNHLATVVLDLGDDQPEVPACGLCALAVLLNGGTSNAPTLDRKG